MDHCSCVKCLISITVKPQLPENFEASTWSKLEAAVRAVHNKQHVATSLEELYRVGEGQQKGDGSRDVGVLF